MSEPRQLVVVSGNSGGGKSVALRALEDIGYYCVDNLPVALLSSFVDGLSPKQTKVAVSIDIRNLPSNPKQVTAVLTTLDDSVQVTVLYLEANEETLIKRYSETRRIHPLSLIKDSRSLQQAIVEEKILLSALKERADLVIDSSKLSIHELSEMVRKRILGRDGQELVMVFQSFGFKYGLPSDVDYVFDVRFLPNPHWEPSLRPLTGLDKPICDYLYGFDDVVELKEQIQAFIERWLPALEKTIVATLRLRLAVLVASTARYFLLSKLVNTSLHKGNKCLFVTIN